MTFDRERQGALMLVKEINQRELLNTLTDAGLIPNYAFPEAGVELKSVLWRKKGSDDVGEGAYVALPAIRYERPASSAISEFAPENRFYANQRRVEVDQINMSLATLEDWRLSPACHHMELLGPQGEGTTKLTLTPTALGVVMRCGAIFHSADPCCASNRRLRIATIRGSGLTIARKIASLSSIPDSYW